MSPQPEQGDGPWGAAIRYWLHKKGWSQADLVRETALGKNTVSYAVRGLDTTTTTLRLIAATLQEPLELILVSPEWKDRQEHQERVIAAAISRAMRDLNAATTGLSPTTIEATQATLRDVEHRLAEKTARHAKAEKPKRRRPRHK